MDGVLYMRLFCKDTSSTVPYMDTFKEQLQQLHIYLRNNCSGLLSFKQSKKALGPPDLTMKASFIENVKCQ